MSGRLLALLVVTALFTILTVIALMDVGYLGIIAPHFQSWGAGQVLADLVILAVLASIWMFADARTSGINAWPFFIITLFFASFGPLLYLIVREVRAGSRKAATS